MKKLFMWLFSILFVFLSVSGCGGGSKTDSSQNSSKSSTVEASLAQFGIKGKVINSTFGSKPDGFMAKVDNKVYLADLKNNQIASIENFAYIDSQIHKIRGRDNSQGPLIPQFLIYNDKHGKDDQMGEWRGNHHFLPIYILIEFDAAGNIRSRGKMSSGKGAAPSHYQGYLEEQKDIDMANLFLREVVPFVDTLDNVVSTSSTNKSVAKTNNQTPIDNGYVNGVDVNLRKEPSKNSDVIRTLDHANISVLEFVKDTSGQEWAKVRLLNDGTEGYIAKQYFKHSEAGYRKDTERSIGRGHIAGTNVIMRNGASREADPIGEFKDNESLEILKYENMPNGERWIKIRRSNGDKGFVFGKYLQKD